MGWRSTADDWGWAIKTLHWLIALGIVALAVLGWWMKGLPNAPQKIEVYALHKSLGLTVLALALLRLALRLTMRRPPPVPGLPPWQRRLSHAVHGGLYLLLFAMPLSGWLFNSAANFPLRWFGLVRVPPLAPPDPALKAIAGAIHAWGVWLLALLLLLHVAGAVKHHLVDRDATLRRMLPRRRAST